MRTRPFRPALLALALSLLIIPGRAPARAGDNAEADAEAAAIEQRLQRPLPQVNFDQVSLADAVDFLRDVTGLNIWVDWHALAVAGVAKDAAVTMRLRNTSLARTFDHLLSNLGPGEGKLGHKVVGRVVVVSTAEGLKAVDEAARAVQAKAREGEAKQVLEQRVLGELNFHAVALEEVIQFLRDVGRADILVDWDKLAAAGVKRSTPVTMRLQKIPLGQALALILREASAGGTPLGFAAEGRVITISTSASLKDGEKPKGRAGRNS